jgi:hypothetical protein
MCRHIPVILPNIKFYVNPLSSSRLFSCLQRVGLRIMNTDCAGLRKRLLKSEVVDSPALTFTICAFNWGLNFGPARGWYESKEMTDSSSDRI